MTYSLSKSDLSISPPINNLDMEVVVYPRLDGEELKSINQYKQILQISLLIIGLICFVVVVLLPYVHGEQL